MTTNLHHPRLLAAGADHVSAVYRLPDAARARYLEACLPLSMVRIVVSPERRRDDERHVIGTVEAVAGDAFDGPTFAVVAVPQARWSATLRNRRMLISSATIVRVEEL